MVGEVISSPFLSRISAIIHYNPNILKEANNMFSILTLNLRFGLADDGPNSWRFRKEIFPSFFKKYNADFIALQEVNDFQVDFINDILKNYSFIGKRAPAPSFWQNNIIFYKNIWKCIFRDHFFLSSTPDIPSRFPGSRWPRQCTIGIFEKKDRKLICINTHFDFSASVQTESAKIIMNRLLILPSDLPALLVGDFNADPSCPCYLIFTGENRKSGKNENCFNNAFKEPFPGTHHGFTGDINGKHIDWILYRGKIIKKESMIIHETLEKIYPSDHYPLYASFAWKKEINK